jgi:hypothetical protein
MKKLIAAVLAAAALVSGAAVAQQVKDPACFTAGVDFCLNSGGAPAGSGE